MTLQAARGLIGQTVRGIDTITITIGDEGFSLPPGTAYLVEAEGAEQVAFTYVSLTGGRYRFRFDEPSMFSREQDWPILSTSTRASELIVRA